VNANARAIAKTDLSIGRIDVLEVCYWKSGALNSSSWKIRPRTMPLASSICSHANQRTIMSR
jgi:hypothetical protein